MVVVAALEAVLADGDGGAAEALEPSVAKHLLFAAPALESSVGKSLLSCQCSGLKLILLAFSLLLQVFHLVLLNLALDEVLLVNPGQLL